MKKYLDIKFTLHRTFAFICMLLLSAGVFAQSISGNVSSEDGPLPGATIVVKGTENGTSTDFDGNFTINASDGDVLIVSFIGFETQEVEVSGDQVDVVLAEGNELDEVVVTGNTVLAFLNKETKRPVRCPDYMLETVTPLFS